MLFNTQATQRVQVAVVPRKMGVGIPKAAHQSPPTTLNNSDIPIFSQPVLLRHDTHFADALSCSGSAATPLNYLRGRALCTFNQYIPFIRLASCGVQDINVEEE